MSHFVSDQKEFATTMDALGGVLNIGETFPARVLKTAPAAFALFEEMLVFSRFFDGIQSALFRLAGGVPVYFASLEPDPVRYFFAHFGKYPLVRYDEQPVDGDAFRKPLNEDPGGSPADAIASRTDRFAMFPADLRWLLFADRNVEVGVVAAFDATMAEQVIRAFPPQDAFDAETALDRLQPAFRGPAPPEFREELLRNYGGARGRTI
jgi:hypothetical protein